MMLQGRSGSGDGGELIDRVSLTSSISFIQSQTFPESIFSQSYSRYCNIQCCCALDVLSEIVAIILCMVSFSTKNALFRVPINAHVCVYDAQKYKRTHIFSSSCVPGTHKNWVLPRHLCNPLGESPCAPSIRHFVYSVMSTQKMLFDIFQPSTTKPSQTSSTGQKTKSDEDPQEISGPKKRVFSSKWLEEFAWLVYVSTENHFLNSNREKTN